MVFVQTCPICGKDYEFKVDDVEFLNYQLSESCIQDVMPTTSATIRECIISGICPDCQKTLFDYDEDGDENDWGDFDDDVDESNYDPYLGCDFYEVDDMF